MLTESLKLREDAEVGDLEIAARIHHQVGRLEVAVNDARMIVRVIERVAELARPFIQVVRSKTLCGLSARKLESVSPSTYSIEMQPDCSLVHEIVNADDVLVRQLEAAPGLAFHVAEDRAVVNDQLGQELERDIALEFVIARQPDDAHSAAAKGFDQRVTAKYVLPCRKVMQR